MKKQLFFLLALITLCFSCQNRPNKQESVVKDTIVQEPVFRVINFTENLAECGKPLLLSDVVDDVEYIKLETPEKGYIAETYNIKMSDKYIILTSFKIGHALLFDRITGKFIRTISKVGQGPGEVLSPSSVGIQDSIIYISSTYIHALFAYKITGEFIKKIPLKENVQYPDMNFIDDYIIHYPGSATIDGLYANAYVQDWNGNVIIESTYQFPGKFSEQLRTDPPRVWTYQGVQNAFSCATDTVYAITKDSIYPRYYIPEGKYKRGICDAKTIVPKDFYDKAIRLGTFIETKEYLLFSFLLDQNIWNCNYNKADSSISLWKYTMDDYKAKKGKFSGLVNDIDGCNYSKAFIKYIDDRSLLNLITPDNVDEMRKIVSESTNVKYPEKRQQLLDLMDSLEPDDNPILAIYTLKD